MSPPDEDGGGEAVVNSAEAAAEENGVTPTEAKPDDVDDEDDDNGEGDDKFNEEATITTSSGSISLLTPTTASTTGGEGDADKPTALNRRESLRAKLRASEKRLLSFTRPSSESGEAAADGSPGKGGGILGQMAAVTADLKKIEEEKSMLEQELSKLQTKTAGDEFLQEKMLGIQQGFSKQVEKIKGLQEELSIKDDEIILLREDLVKKLRRIVELEFDLETHSIHFTNYAKEQFRLGEEALAEIKGGASVQRSPSLDNSVSSVTTAGEHSEALRSSSSSVASPSKKGSQRKAQKLISKLLADLDDLEARYKADRLDAASELHKTQMSMEHLRTRIQVLELEKHQQEQEKAQEKPAENGDGTPPPEQQNMTYSTDHTTAQVLRKRNQTLEARRVLSQQEIDRLHAELTASHNRTKQLQVDHDSKVSRMEMENVALTARLAELEKSARLAATQQLQSQQQQQTSKKGGGLLGKIRKSGSNNNNSSSDISLSSNSEQPLQSSLNSSSYAATLALEAKMKSSCEKIALLEAERSIKDRQIATLKKEVASLRMKEIAYGATANGNATQQQQRDAQLLQSPTGRRQMHNNIADHHHLQRLRKKKKQKKKQKKEGNEEKEKSDDDADDVLLDDGEEGDEGSDDDDEETFAYISELQMQLQEAQQLLVKKDQELVIERAKSASTAAGLLARITELSTAQQQQSASSASSPGKQQQLPLRFYL